MSCLHAWYKSYEIAPEVSKYGKEPRAAKSFLIKIPFIKIYKQIPFSNHIYHHSFHSFRGIPIETATRGKNVHKIAVVT